MFHRAEDNDPGLSGTVNCQASHMAFTLEKLIDTEQSSTETFMVKLMQGLDREESAMVS